MSRCQHKGKGEIIESASHWNGNILCSIDVETTGLDPLIHEIWQVAIIPLDGNFNMRKDIPPYYIFIKPEYPECVDPKAIIHSKDDFKTALTSGIDHSQAEVTLDHWMEHRLKLPLNKGKYNRCKIIPLGHNYGNFDLKFMQAWLGDNYNEWFDIHYRDTFTICSYLNDATWNKGNTNFPFPRMRLKTLANEFNIECDTKYCHNAMYDARITALIYKKLITRGFTDLNTVY